MYAHEASFACHKELLTSMAVTHGINAVLTPHAPPSLVLVKGNDKLEIMQLRSKNEGEEPQLSLVYSAQLQGTVVDVRTIRFPGEQFDSLIILSNPAKMSILQWDIASASLATVSLHYYDELVHEMSIFMDHTNRAPLLRVDPQNRCILLYLFRSLLIVFPVRETVLEVDITPVVRTDSKNNAAADENPEAKLHASVNNSRYLKTPMLLTCRPGEDLDGGQEEVNADKPASGGAMFTRVASKFKFASHQHVYMMDITTIEFLNGYELPTIAALHHSHITAPGRAAVTSNTGILTSYTIDLNKQLVAVFNTVSELPSDTSVLIPIPEPHKGCFVASSSVLLHFNHQLCDYALSVNELGMTCTQLNPVQLPKMALMLTGCRHVFLSPTAMLLATLEGFVYLVTFVPIGLNVQSIKIVEVGIGACPSCFVWLRSNYVLLGSAVTHSLLLKATTREKIEDTKASTSALFRTDEDDILEAMEEDTFNTATPAKISKYSKTPLTLTCVDVLTNMGPVVSFDYGYAPDLKEKYEKKEGTVSDAARSIVVELAAISGRVNDGGVTLVTTGVIPTVVKEVPLHEAAEDSEMQVDNDDSSRYADGVLEVFSLQDANNSTAYVLSTTKDNTIVSHPANSGLVSDKKHNFATGRTLAAAEVTLPKKQQHAFVQVHDTGICVLSAKGTLVSSIKLESIQSACVYSHGLVVCHLSESLNVAVFVLKGISGKKLEFTRTDGLLDARNGTDGIVMCAYTHMTGHEDDGFSTKERPVASTLEEKNSDETTEMKNKKKKKKTMVDEDMDDLDAMLLGSDSDEEDLSSTAKNEKEIDISTVDNLDEAMLLSRVSTNDKNTHALIGFTDEGVARESSPDSSAWLLVSRQGGAWLELYLLESTTGALVRRWASADFNAGYPLLVDVSQRAVEEETEDSSDITGVAIGQTPQVVELCLTRLSNSEPHLLAFLSTGDLVAYKSFGLEGQLRFSRVNHKFIARGWEATRQARQRNWVGGRRLVPMANVGGRMMVFVGGMNPAVITSDRDYLRIHSLHMGLGYHHKHESKTKKKQGRKRKRNPHKKDTSGVLADEDDGLDDYVDADSKHAKHLMNQIDADAVVSAACFHSPACPHGLISLDYHGRAKLAVLPRKPDVLVHDLEQHHNEHLQSRATSLLASTVATPLTMYNGLCLEEELPYRYLPLQATVHFIVRHEDTQTYAVVLSRRTPRLSMVSFDDETGLKLYDDKYELLIYDARTWHVVGRYDGFKDNEAVMALNTVRAEGHKHYLALGTGDFRHEQHTSRGRCIVLLPKFTIGTSHTQGQVVMLKLEAIVHDELHPVTAIAEVENKLLYATQNVIKLFRIKVEKKQLEVCAFWFTHTHVHALATLKNFVAYGDPANGVHMVYYDRGINQFHLLGSHTATNFQVFSVGFMVHHGDMCVVCCDAHGNTQLFKYLPLRDETFRNRELSIRGDFYAGHKILTTRIMLAGGAVQGGEDRAVGEASLGQLLSTSRRVTKPDVSASDTPWVDGTADQKLLRTVTIGGTKDAGLLSYLSLDKSLYFRMYSLFSILSYSVKPVAGLNPRAHRLYHSAIPPRKYHKNIIDISFLHEFLTLDVYHQWRIARTIGTTPDEIVDNLALMEQSLVF